MKTRSRKKAFTLIELLVVVAIIAILASLLVRIAGAGFERAHDSACQNNLHQLAIALTVMTDGYKPYPPAQGADSGTSYFGPQGPLLTAIEPYLKGASNVLFCPRAVKLEGVTIKDELAAGRIGYFYWAWKAENGVTPLRPGDSTNVWISQGWNSSLGQLVLMTDHFRDKGAWALDSDWQFHGSRDVRRSLNQPGTFAVMDDGSVHKIAPRP
ncbi:MAG: prepilin-type N-terminal cleavage/methylation domain-containing protein [Verrucomicrobia bacterium]|nr:prepilin-type N-terminal cleavage/methylation domain-containing protein [Kiritimatiellia bacterium]MCO6401374.1 prepilin-type N-terminal cleavage/methylation domain-containing protein [Verrucomicrobiota bacterium]